MHELHPYHHRPQQEVSVMKRGNAKDNLENMKKEHLSIDLRGEKEKNLLLIIHRGF